MIGTELQEKAPFDMLKIWQNGGAQNFLNLCELTAELPRVANDLQVDASALATFCNKWHAVEKFRPKGEEDAEWQPITPEMNDLRQTMISELEELSG